MFKFEARATRIVSFMSSDGEIPPPQTAQLGAGNVDDDPAPASLSGNRARALRAEELVASIKRSLGEYDFAQAREQGRELESLLTTAQQGSMPTATLKDGFTVLCRVTIALVQQDGEASAMHLTRARDFLERARNVTQS